MMLKALLPIRVAQAASRRATHSQIDLDTYGSGARYRV